jgi:hypothetical protein
VTEIRTIPHALIDPVQPIEDVTITVSLPARYAVELDRLAADVDTDASDWARSALLEAIDPHNRLRVYKHTVEEEGATS